MAVPLRSKNAVCFRKEPSPKRGTAGRCGRDYIQTTRLGGYLPINGVIDGPLQWLQSRAQASVGQTIPSRRAKASRLHFCGTIRAPRIQSACRLLRLRPWAPIKMTDPPDAPEYGH